ncbi:MAG: hypothetical protein ABSH11_14320 [Verrucomicrobiota bacterium]
MNIDLLPWFIKFASRTVILFAVVWILIRLQKLDQNVKFHFLKLLAVIVLASGLDTVPYSGHYISVFVLLLGIKIVTGSSYADVLFTVGISYALMFAVNLFIIGSLMGNLRPSTRDAVEPAQYDYGPREQTVETVPEKVAKTNPPVSVVVSNPAPVRVTRYTIKGISRNGAKSVVTVDTGTKAYTLFLGDTLTMQTAEGTSRVRFENLDADWVTLNIDGKSVKLSAH